MTIGGVPPKLINHGLCICLSSLQWAEMFLYSSLRHTLLAILLSVTPSHPADLKKQFDNDTFGGSLLFEHMCYLYAKPSSNLTLFMGGIPTGKLWVAYDCLILIQKLENQHD